MSVRNAALAALLAAAFMPATAPAQQTPCTGCAIARSENAAQMRANQAAVNTMLGNALNSQLQTQSQNLGNAALERSAALGQAASAGSLELQQLLIMQQLQLLQLEQREALKRRPVPKKRQEPGHTPPK